MLKVFIIFFIAGELSHSQRCRLPVFDGKCFQHHDIEKPDVLYSFVLLCSAEVVVIFPVSTSKIIFDALIFLLADGLF